MKRYTLAAACTFSRWRYFDVWYGFHWLRIGEDYDVCSAEACTGGTIWLTPLPDTNPLEIGRRRRPTCQKKPITNPLEVGRRRRPKFFYYVGQNVRRRQRRRRIFLKLHKKCHFLLKNQCFFVYILENFRLRLTLRGLLISHAEQVWILLFVESTYMFWKDRMSLSCRDASILGFLFVP